MSKRHLPRNAVTQIGNERISILTDLAYSAAREGRDDRASRYIMLAKRIGMKTRTGIPKEFKYCKECCLPMIPGTNCRVRLDGHKVITTCTKCGAVRRMPYLKEQRE
ncbi:MAG: ribonuclease P protein component 4 [Candidatus Methanomethylophilaceae archaeon]|jgi:ribonuclease P protein subunit RPR2